MDIDTTKPLNLAEAAELLERERDRIYVERDYRYPRGVVKEQPPLVNVRWLDKRTGLRWRGTGVSYAAISDTWAEAAVSGSVGASDYMNHQYIGGCEYLMASVHRIDQYGNDVPPK